MAQVIKSQCLFCSVTLAEYKPVIIIRHVVVAVVPYILVKVTL